VTSPAASAYSETADAWQRGPGRIYDRMSEAVVERSAVPVAGARALDLGAGTGAASRALLRAAAARVVAVDAAFGMLALDAGRRPPAVMGDALALPFAPRAFDVTVAAFSLTHLADPGAGLAEAARVTRRGGAVLAAAYAIDDFHPVKEAVEAALAARGWRPEPWYQAVRATTAPKLATVEAAKAAAAEADLDADVVSLRVPFPGLDAGDLVSWRFGLAQHAPFVASLAAEDRDAVVAAALDRLGSEWPELERSIILVRAAVR
jgi:ubiquinone/menaquinone biosynthesis C-methylase UbiE